MDKSQLVVSTYNKIADIYSKQYFNDQSDIPYMDLFLERLPNGSHILDVGCGPGQFSKYMISKGFNVQGIDLSEEMIKIAKEKVVDGNFKVMDMRKLKYRDNSFDGILVSYSLIHIPSSEVVSTLKGFYRVLKSNGYLMLIVQKGEPDRTIDEPLMKGEETFINFFTIDQIKKYLSDNGYKIEFIKEEELKDPEGLSDSVIYTLANKP